MHESEMIPDKFKALFMEHYPSVLRKLSALVADRAVAEDLAQETFLRLYRTPPDELDKVGAWLHRVLTRLAYDYLRQAGRREQVQAREQARFVSEEQAEPGSEQLVIQNWERDVVKSVLAKLSQRDREALLMRENGYSYAEIAERLQVNPKIVGSLIMRATARFRKNYPTEAVDE
ncbi:sigma-70 family RNA polymerase sigma factor [Paenibacillus sp. HJGM_3]|uniref:sigma-70 family RNA polymerase sigma factor n=1 Tax=Paenibacillus sp. HJGM_3 TaxID=3379816 RepID=UPI0038597CD2